MVVVSVTKLFINRTITTTYHDRRAYGRIIDLTFRCMYSIDSYNICKRLFEIDKKYRKLTMSNKNSPLFENIVNDECLSRHYGTPRNHFSAGRFQQVKEQKVTYHRDSNHLKNDTKEVKLPNDSSCGTDKTDVGSRHRIYDDVVKDINTLQTNAQAIATANIDPSERMPLFMEHLNLAGISLDDIDNLNVIHVSGTKGKGSTCAFVESILRANHYKTGFFNSPHLIKYTERIRLDGQPISDEKFSMYFSEVFDRLKLKTEDAGLKMPAFFAFMTILAFHIFIKEKVQVAIMEVGIGGLLDTTNVVNRPIVCGITSLDYDHVTILGNSIESIAKHKAGIIKRKVPVFTVPHQPEEALIVIKAQADFLDSPLVICPPIESYKLDLGIKGQAQSLNASLAIQLSRVWMARQSETNYVELMPDSNIHFNEGNVRGLKDCHWPGRCQIVEKDNITFFLDGAHTRNSLINCKEWFRESSFGDLSDQSNVTRYLILNIIGDRSRESLMQQLVDLEFDAAIFTKNKVTSEKVKTRAVDIGANSKGSDNSLELSQTQQNARIWRSIVESRRCDKNQKVIETQSTLEALECIYSKSRERENQANHVLVTGSLHLVGAVLEAIDIMESMKSSVH